MKLNRLETHDRYQHFTSQNFDITARCQNLIDQRPFGNTPFYIFAHARTHEDGVNKRLIWQPRLTKPKAQSNSMLFKAYPGTDLIKIIWIIPDRALWGQYIKGNVTANEFIAGFIREFQTRREKLECKEEDDLSDKEIFAIYQSLKREKENKVIKQASEVASLNLF